MTDINRLLSPSQIRAVKMYLSGTPLYNTALRCGVSMTELRMWIRTYLYCADLIRKERMRSAALRQKLRKEQEEFCKGCPWRNNGIPICVLPRCFKIRLKMKGSDPDGI